MSRISQRRKDMYVVGAGFSAGLGYPLTSNLLIEAWELMEPLRNSEQQDREGLEKVIRSHHPQFDASQNTSFPNIEQLLTEFSVNEALFDASRPSEGIFKRHELYDLREQKKRRI